MICYHLLISVVEILLPWLISSYPCDGPEDEGGKDTQNGLSEPREARSGTGAPMHISTRHHPQASISHMETPPPEFSQFNLFLSSPNLLFSFSLIPSLEGGQKIVFNSSLSSSTKSKPAMTILSPYKLTEVFFFISYT